MKRWSALASTILVVSLLGVSVAPAASAAPEAGRERAVAGAEADQITTLVVTVISGILRTFAEALRSAGLIEAANAFDWATDSWICAALGCDPPPPGTRVLMEPSHDGGFFAMPWPNDTRLSGDGTMDLVGFPFTDQNPLMRAILSAGAGVTEGFGINSATYFQTSSILDPASLPSVETTMTTASPILLVPLDEPSAPPVPLLIDFHESGSVSRPDNLLTLLPYPGHPLNEQARYAAVITDGVLDSGGEALIRSPLLDELDDPWSPLKPVNSARWTALREQRDAVYAYVEANTPWAASDVVAFSVFTTQDATGDMEAIAAAVEDLPDPQPLSISEGTCAGPAGDTRITGTVELPLWQEGERPYVLSGGDIVVGPDGKAVQQGTETVDFELAIPCGEAPPEGWPILVFMDGTGAGANADDISYFGSTDLPYAVGSVAPLYSGDRTVPGLPTELLFFNFLNPEAGRTNQLQQAADNLFLERMMEGLSFDGEELAAAGIVETNDEVVVVSGHSQGALTVPHALAVEDDLDGGILSSGGGGFYHALVHRGDTRPLVESLLGFPGEELDMFHPVLNALQAIAERGDAAVYGPHVEEAHVLAITGIQDGCSPLETQSHLATAAGWEVAHPLYFPVFGSASAETSTVDFPVSSNLPDGRTAVEVQLDTGHYGSSSHPELALSFLESLADGGTPVVEEPPEFISTPAFPCLRHDPLP